jgi:hypothetical protein
MGALLLLGRSWRRLNYSLWIRRSNSMPAIVIAAVSNRLNPSIGPMRDFTPRSSCSIRLFRYFDERNFVSDGSCPPACISRTARCDAAYPSNVMVRGGAPCTLIALQKNALVAVTSRLILSRRSTVFPSRSTARAQIGPFAADLHVGLLDAPRRTCRLRELVPATLEFRNIMMHPTHDGGVGHR